MSVPSFGYYPEADRIEVPLDRSTFSRALVLDFPVRTLVDRVTDCRVLWSSEVALPEGIYWFEGIDRPIILQVGIGVPPGGATVAALSDLDDGHPLAAAFGHHFPQTR